MRGPGEGVPVLTCGWDGFSGQASCGGPVWGRRGMGGPGRRAARGGRPAGGPQAAVAGYRHPLLGFAPSWPVLAGLGLDSGAGVGEAWGVGEALRVSSAEGLV